MNKTVTANIGQREFTLNDDAFMELELYIQSIKKTLDKEEDLEEIMQDIESRISEILSERLGNKRSIVNIADIDHIKSLMGYADQIADIEEEESNSSNKEKVKERALFKDHDNKVVDGVCSGIAAYFRIDPVFIRIAFGLLLFAGGFSLFLYFLLAISMKKAVTSSDKLKMRGEKVSIKSIKKAFDNETINTKEIKRYSNSIINKILYQIEVIIGFLYRTITLIVKKVYSIAVVILKVLLRIVQVLLLLASSVAFVFLTVAVFFNKLIGDISINSNVDIFAFEFPEGYGFIIPVTYVTIAIPLILIIYYIFCSLFKFKSVNNKYILITAGSIWAIAIGIMSYGFAMMGIQNVQPKHIRHSHRSSNSHRTEIQMESYLLDVVSEYDFIVTKSDNSI